MDKYRPDKGDTCLMNIPDIDNAWYEYTIDYIGKHTVVVSCKDVSERSRPVDSVYFKPLPNLVDEMMIIVDGLSDNYACCKALHRAGYRKIPDFKTEQTPLCGLKLD